MSVGAQFYVSTLLVYLGVDVIACWALNLQFGVGGVLNLAFIFFQAAGAYTAAVLSLGPQTQFGGFQHYIGGTDWPFPLPILAAGVVGALLSVVVGFIVLRRLRRDYQAVTLLVISIIAWTVIGNDQALFNGTAGLALVPHPLSDGLGLSLVDYGWFYAGLTAIVAAIAYIAVRLITRAPLGRTLRAIRDDEHAAAAMGKNVFQMRLLVMVIGGILAALSGAMLVGFIGIWSPGAWSYQETLVVLAAVIIGGVGNNWGVALGALIVPVGIGEAARFLPDFGPAGFIPAMQWVVIGIALLVFVYFWPRGVISERPRRYKLLRPTTKRVGEDAAWTI